jgi:hypothetical protein
MLHQPTAQLLYLKNRLTLQRMQPIGSTIYLNLRYVKKT